ncbi:response regulator transcription factor [Aquibacillus rhizosphaerae]|uniref:Response regulator transcription factor n=1 Tax=Aquibacillus rhizosphaerae TaxID=3051431 RepID=A0ABT7L154_9BACI|nr:response regulator transcription factor [Aquibacillus sp. LR5S19]MDL4838912.1 response regulator transcription factor [Aquibacillus sp. LR5S19]
MIKILIVDDHEVVGEGTKSLLSSVEEFRVDFIVCSKEANELIKKNKYDVYIFDLNMPGKNGVELTDHLLSIDEDAKVIIFTGHDISSHFNHLVEIGVSGFISKECSKKQLIRAIWCAIDGQAVVPVELLYQLRRTENQVKLRNGNSVSLSQTEEAILIRVAKSNSNDEIADELYMSRRNVERHLTKIFKKLQVNSRSEAMIKGKELGLLPEIVV